MEYILEDTGRLRQWLDRKKQNLEAIRSPYDSLWEEIRKVYEPTIGLAITGDASYKNFREDEKIINSKPRDLLHRLSSGLQSGITNQAKQWFLFSTKDKNLMNSNSVRKYCEQATEAVQNAINRSNIYTSLDQLYLQLGAFGTAASLIVPDEKSGVRMIVCDAGSYWISQDITNRVDTLLRRMRMSLSQLRDDFGVRALSEHMIQMIAAGRSDDEVTVYNLVYPSDTGIKIRDIDESRTFTSVYWIEEDYGKNGKNHGILDIRSYGYNPIVAPRWTLRSNSPYGVGCGEIGLGDALELQALERASLKIVAMEADPPIAAPASMRDEVFDLNPGGITFYNSVQGGAIPVQRVYEARQSIEAVQLKIQNVEQRLGNTFFTDLFALMINLNLAPKRMTATEVTELTAEKVALLGPILTRLNSDLLRPLVDAVWSIVVTSSVDNEQDEYGVLTPPSMLEDKEMKIEFMSTLHTEQMSNTRLSSIDMVLQRIANAANVIPDIIDNFDADEYAMTVARSSYEGGIIRDKKDVEAIRAARAKAIQAAQAAQSAQNQLAQSEVIKNLSQSKVGNGSQNALGMMIDRQDEEADNQEQMQEVEYI